jgi:hypothetical protein
MHIQVTESCIKDCLCVRFRAPASLQCLCFYGRCLRNIRSRHVRQDTVVRYQQNGVLRVCSGRGTVTSGSAGSHLLIYKGTALAASQWPSVVNCTCYYYSMNMTQ